MLIIGFGDSITAAVDLPEEQTFLSKVGRRYGYETRNAGVPGHTSSQGLARFEEDVLKHKPDICLIGFGMNDHYAVAEDVANVPLDTFKQNLKTIVNRLQKINCLPVLMTIHPIIVGDAESYYYARHPEEWFLNPKGAQAWIDQYSEAIRQVAGDEEAILVDIAGCWAEALDEGESLEDLLKTVENSGIDDGVHPTIAGHKVYTQCLISVMDALDL